MLLGKSGIIKSEFKQLWFHGVKPTVYVLLFERVCINGCPTLTNFQNVTLKVYFLYLLCQQTSESV